MIKKLHNPLTKNYKTLKEIVLGTRFAWCFYPRTVYGGDKSDLFLSHTVLARTDLSSGDLYPKGRSNWIDSCEFVLKEIFIRNNIEINCLLRINFNMTLPIPGIISTTPHHDHQFPHTNLIIYLNDCDGETVICNEKDEIIESFNPKEDSIITFNSKHYHMLPSKGRRVVMVCTYI